MTTTTAGATEEGGDDNNMGAEDGDDDNEADYTKWRGGGDKEVKDANDEEDEEDEEDVMDLIGVLPPLVAHRVERLTFLNKERERIMDQYLKDRAALETKYSDICAKDDDDEEGRMVGILQFWVCAMGHMEAVDELIT